MLDEVRVRTPFGIRIDYTAPSGEVVYSRYAYIFPRRPWRIVALASLATLITLVGFPILLAVLGG